MKRKLNVNDLVFSTPKQLITAPAILLPASTTLLKKTRFTYRAEKKKEVLNILSHCITKESLDLGVLEIERLCPAFNGLTTRKIEMWRVNEGRIANKRGPKVAKEFEQDVQKMPIEENKR
mmetsp:Transcript_17979/g.24645  ORF Transcript_17979/g.24645 Transcript_17979/m.24645 type:complete len:120 (+) Transcript_17979:328-687(+)